MRILDLIKVFFGHLIYEKIINRVVEMFKIMERLRASSNSESNEAIQNPEELLQDQFVSLTGLHRFSYLKRE